MPPAGSGTTDDTRTRQPAHQSFDQTAPASTPVPGGAATSAPNATAATGTEDSESSSRYADAWLGQDTFVVDKTPARDHDSAPVIRRSFAGLFVLATSTRATRMEAKARRSHETAQVSPLGPGPPRPGIPLPNQNPFFNLLSGPGGAAAGLMLASMLAVLGAALVLPRDRFQRFRMPTVTWSPLAYVPPIELPG
jgi:hypothetical protein